MKLFRCQLCGVEDPAQFYDSVQNWCREHWLARCRTYRKANPEPQRRWNERNREAKNVLRAKWNQNNPARMSAHKEVRKAVDRGDLVRMPCRFCGKEKAQAHHPDYTKPLLVVWLCSGCHQKLHAIEQMKESPHDQSRKSVP